MSISVILVPGAPVMVPELSGAAAEDSARQVGQIVETLRRTAVGATGVRVYGTDPGGRTVDDVRSTLARWGADVPVGRTGSRLADHDRVPDAALIAWWLLDRAGIALPRVFTGVTSESPHTLMALESELVVVVADGAASLTPRAPVPEDPRGVDLDARLTGWLRTGGELPDPGREVAEEVGWWSRPAWLMLAEIIDGRQPNAAHSWAPFGVGYHHAVWDDVPRPAEYRSGAAG